MNNILSIAKSIGISSRPTTNPKQYLDNLYFGSNKAGEKYLQEVRGFNHETIQHFKLGLNDQGEITIPIFKSGELIDYKYRGIEEKTFRRHHGSENWVINDIAFENCLKEGYLICVEGEFDAIALWQLGFKSVVSTTGGSQGGTPWVKEVPDNVKIYINYDNDEPGQEAARKLADKLGIQRCYNVILPCKDANDFIIGGGTKEHYQEILDNSPRFKIQNVYKLSEVLDNLEKNKLPRVSVFSDRITAKMNGGIPSQSLVVISGDTGVGKSTILLNFLSFHANQGKPVLLISLENDIYFTVQRLLEIKLQKRYQDFTTEDWVRIREEMLDYPFYIDTSMETYTLDRLEKIVDQAKRLYDIEFLGFDHIGFLPTRDEPKEIAQMMRGLKLISRHMNIITYVISHINRDKEDGYPTLRRLKGSSAIEQDSDIVMFVVPTKEGHEVSIDKARMSPRYFRVPVYFDGDTGVMKDDFSRDVKRFDEIIPDEPSENQKKEVLPEDKTIDY